jgi:hypothetical protein
MSENPLPVWRQALNDSSHPLNKASWLLFGKNTKAEAAAQILADQKEQVIPYLYQILDTEELYFESALGSGNAPVNAVGLLGEWQVLEAVPHLIKIIEQDDWDSSVHDEALGALDKMGATIIPDIIDLGQRAERGELSPDVIISAAGTLSAIGKGNADAYTWLLHIFDTNRDTHEELLSEILLAVDREKAYGDLESRLKTRKFPKPVRQRIEKNIRDARAGKF